MVSRWLSFRFRDKTNACRWVLDFNKDDSGNAIGRNHTFNFFTLSNRFNPPGQQEFHSHAGFTENLIATDGPPDGMRAEPENSL